MIASLRQISKSQVFLLLLPILFSIFFLFILRDLSCFYMTGHDPVYPYLMNAVNLADGHLEVGIVEHPGTPVECFGAVVLYCNHLFSGKGPIFKEVIQNPEHYLHLLSVSLILLLSLVSLFTGLYVYRQTGNMVLALFFQLTPIARPFLLDHALLFKPESFVVAMTTFLSSYLYVNAFVTGRDQEKGLKLNVLIVCGILFGLLIATKIIYAPFLFIVFLLLKSLKQFLVFCVTLTLSFCLFIIPVLAKWSMMTQWIKNLLNHDGRYGGGKEQIVDGRLFISHLKELFTEDLVFSAIYIILTSAFLVAIIRFLKKIPGDSTLSRFATGLWISITLLILLVAKHYSFHYLIGAIAYLPLVIVVSIRVFILNSKRKFFTRYRNALLIVPGAFCLLLAALFTIQASAQQRVFTNVERRTHLFLSRWEGVPAITVSDTHSSFVAPSVWFGIMYAGDYRSKYFQFARKCYPSWFSYNPQTKSLMHWDEMACMTEILRKYHKTLVYFIEQDSSAEATMLKELTSSFKQQNIASVKKIYSDSESNEDIYLLTADSFILPKEPAAKMYLSSDLETLSNDHTEFLTSDPRFYLTKAVQISTQEHHSGTHSIRLDQANPYGLDLQFEVNPGDLVEAKIWRKTMDLNGSIVFHSDGESHLYSGGEAIVDNSTNGWEQIRCRIRVPADYKEKTLSFNLFYWGKNAVYFDDLTFSVVPAD